MPAISVMRFLRANEAVGKAKNRNFHRCNSLISLATIFEKCAKFDFSYRFNVHNEGRAPLSIVRLGCARENSCREMLLALESNGAIGTALVYCIDQKSR